MPGSVMGERRKQVRRRTLKSGKIVFNHKSSVVDCAVRNLSEVGALLIVPNAAGIPNAFELIDSEGVAHNCTVAWKADGKIGVDFKS
jgi:hypothetical protein